MPTTHAGSGSALDHRIAEVAADQHGVVTRGQLRAAGVATHRIDTLVRSRRLRPLHRGVYLLGALVGRLEPPRAREMAAVLACGPHALLSHASAGALWGLLAPPPRRGPVHVTVSCTRSESRPGLRVHRAYGLHPDDATSVDRVPITSAARTLVDLASRLGPRGLEQALARAARDGLAGSDEVLAALRRRPRIPGGPLLRELLASRTAPALTRSQAEERLLALVREGELPAPDTNARIGSLEVDFLWRSEGVVVEVDGFAYHASRRSFETDRLRDARLAAAGFRVVRITWRQLVHRPSATLVRVAQVLAVAQGG